ncbi:hypothetical protein BOTCAL_0260g00080 [Botryotinia calthae]|uniref:chitinase n=1 Tax=Botryotinia calthae TaxID=38488 RepID=A0A4Y8CX10_9HELO|nr:hypothetical protein BOTCAL_0260g00080 [Botryotinia calthae]
MLSVQRHKSRKILADTHKKINIRKAGRTAYHDVKNQIDRDDPALRNSRLSLSISDQERLDYLLEHIWSEWYLNGGGLKSSELAIEVFRAIQRPLLEQLHEEGIQTSKAYKDAFQDTYKKRFQEFLEQMDHLRQAQKAISQYLQRSLKASKKDDNPYEKFLRETKNSSEKGKCVVQKNASQEKDLKVEQTESNSVHLDCASEVCVANCDQKSECDPGYGAFGYSEIEKCPLNVCCSKWGFCGLTEEFCGNKTVTRPSCSSSGSTTRRAVGYYEGWANRKLCQPFTPDMIPLGIYAHINFAFASIDPITFTDDRNGRPADFHNFPSFIANLKSHLTPMGRGGVSITLPASYWYLQYFDIEKLQKSVDFFNIMSCRFSSGGNAGPCTNSVGTLLNAEITDRIKENGLKPIHYVDAAVKIVTWDNQWVAYDNAETYQQKLDFARSQCLGGIMVWALSQDSADLNSSNAIAITTNSNSCTSYSLKSVESTTEDGDQPSTTVITNVPYRQCRWSDCGSGCESLGDNFLAVKRAIGEGDGKSGHLEGEDIQDSSYYGSTSFLRKLCCPTEQTMQKCAHFFFNNGKFNADNINSCTDLNEGYVEVGSINSFCNTREKKGGYEQICCTTDITSMKLYSQSIWNGKPGQCDTKSTVPVNANGCPTNSYNVRVADSSKGSGGIYCGLEPVPFRSLVTCYEGDYSYDKSQVVINDQLQKYQDAVDDFVRSWKEKCPAFLASTANEDDSDPGSSASNLESRGTKGFSSVETMVLLLYTLINDLLDGNNMLRTQRELWDITMNSIGWENIGLTPLRNFLLADRGFSRRRLSKLLQAQQVPYNAEKINNVIGASTNGSRLLTKECALFTIPCLDPDFFYTDPNSKYDYAASQAGVNPIDYYEFSRNNPNFSGKDETVHQLGKRDGASREYSVNLGTYAQGNPQIIFIWSFPYPSGQNGQTLVEITCNIQRYSLNNPADCNDASYAPTADFEDTPAWVVEHIFELQTPARLLEFMVSGILPKVVTGGVTIPEYRTQRAVLDPDILAKYFQSPYQTWDRKTEGLTGRHDENLVHCLGAKDNTKNFHLMDAAGNALKSRVLAIMSYLSQPVIDISLRSIVTDMHETFLKFQNALNTARAPEHLDIITLWDEGVRQWAIHMNQFTRDWLLIKIERLRDLWQPFLVTGSPIDPLRVYARRMLATLNELELQVDLPTAQVDLKAFAP